MSSTPAEKFQYQVGGSLEKNAPCYVTRQADEDFYQALKAGEFCYVLNSRQMGKSSLRVRVMQRLQAEGVACAVIDITSIGSQGITAAEWYLGIVRRLVRAFRVKLDALEWWNGREGLSPVQRLSEFLEEELLVTVTQPIAIFIDEIDSILKLDFKDDFFALIRACYNQRAERSDYQRLTFALLGVATPSDLIQDKNRTPFNIGRAIAVEGFQLQEAQPLVPGLAGKAERPEAVLQAILEWTGGQPFLTQKLCQLVAKSPGSIAPSEEAAAIAQCVQSSIIDQWEAQDDPEHLKTIRDRVLNNEQQQGQVLGLYQTVLQQGAIAADRSAEQMQLRLSGLVVERQGQITVYNPIYAAVFNQTWTEAILARLRPYATAFAAWEASGRQDESRLLRGDTLQEAEAWAQGKSLGEADFQFLQASEQAKSRAEREAMTKANEILANAKRTATRRLAIASILLGVAVPTAAISGWQALQAKEQTATATEKANQADGQAKTAEVRVTAAIDREQKAKVRFQTAQTKLISATQQMRAASQKVINAQEKLVNLEKQSTEQIQKAAQEVAVAREKVEKSRQEQQRLERAKKDAESQLEIANQNVNIAQQAARLEQEGASVLRQLELESNDKGRVLLAAINSAQTLRSLVESNPLEQYPATSPLMALQSVLDNLLPPQDQINRQQTRMRGSNSSKSQVVNISLVFIPDGDLAIADQEGRIQIFNQHGELSSQFFPSQGVITSLSVSPDGKKFATVGQDGVLRVWNRQSGQQKGKGFKPSKIITKASFSPNGTLMATLNGDNVVDFWNWSWQNPDQPKSLALKPNNPGWQDISDINLNNDGKISVTTHQDGMVRVWRRVQNNLIKVSEFNSYQDFPKSSLSPDGQYIATIGNEGILKLWNLRGKQVAQFGTNNNTIAFAGFSFDGKQLAWAENNGKVRIQPVSNLRDLIARGCELLQDNYFNLYPDEVKLACPELVK